MKNHLICIKELNKRNYDSTTYVDSIESKLESYNSIFDTGSTIFSNLIDNAIEACDCINEGEKSVEN